LKIHFAEAISKKNGGWRESDQDPHMVSAPDGGIMGSGGKQGSQASRAVLWFS
jgi:hypothetical protein